MCFVLFYLSSYIWPRITVEGCLTVTSNCQFSKAAETICIPTSNIEECQLFHILGNARIVSLWFRPGVMVPVWHFLMNDNFQHLHLCILTFWVSSFVNNLLTFLHILKTGLFAFSFLICKIYLYFLDTSPSPDLFNVNIFLQYIAWIFLCEWYPDK